MKKTNEAPEPVMPAPPEGMKWGLRAGEATTTLVLRGEGTTSSGGVCWWEIESAQVLPESCQGVVAAAHRVLAARARKAVRTERIATLLEFVESREE